MRNTLEVSSADDCPYLHTSSPPHLGSASNRKAPPSRTFMVVGNYFAIWSFGKLEASAQGQMAPGKPSPGGRGRQSAADSLNTGM